MHGLFSSLVSSADTWSPAATHTHGPLLAALDPAFLPALFAGVMTGGAALATVWMVERRKRKRMQRRLAEQELALECMRRVLDQSSEGLMMTEAKSGRIVVANRKAAALLGYEREELRDMHFSDLHPKELREEMKGRFDLRMNEEAPVEEEQGMRRWDGSVAVLGVNSIPVNLRGRAFMQSVVRDLTRVKQTQRELIESEARRAALFEGIPVAILEKDYTETMRWIEKLRDQGAKDISDHLRRNPAELLKLYAGVEVVAANRDALRRLHLEEAAPTKSPLPPEAIAPHLLSLFQRELEALWEGRVQMACTIAYTRADGALAQVMANWSAPVPLAYGGHRNGLIVFTDLTDLRQTEERLRESEERPKLALEGFNVGIWECNFSTGKCFYSDRWKMMLGYEVQEIGDRREEWLSRVHPEDRDAVEKALQAHLHGKSSHYESVHRVRCKDGRHKWVFSRGQAVFDKQGNALKMVGAHADISESKQAEEELATERERLRMTLRAMGDAVLIADAAGRIQFMNAAAEALTGWSTSAAMGQSLREHFVFGHSTGHERLELPKLDVASGLVEAELPAQCALQTRKGDWLHVEGRLALLFDVKKNPLGTLLVMRDVGLRHRLEVEQQRNSRLESLSLLAGGIAHDFNNVLTVVMGNLALLEMDLQLSGPVAGWLREAEKGLIKARDLTGRLQTFAKGGDPVRSAFALADVVKETTEFALHGSKVRATFTFDPKLWQAEADKVQIAQVVQNLVINAVQAMPSGGELFISLDNKVVEEGQFPGLEKGNYVKLCIRDTGQGISEEIIGKIFDPYFTTKPTGSGLGLATVYSVVKRHNGRIDVESVHGQGTTFHIHLPAAVKLPASERTEPSPKKTKGLRVLFLDDEEPIRRLGAAILQGLGHEVKVVPDGTAAVVEHELARKAANPFDLLILDLTVPGGKGALAVMDELRRRRATVRAIVMSGYDSDPVVGDPQAHGFCGVLLKPYRASDLNKALQRAMELRPLETIKVVTH